MFAEESQEGDKLISWKGSKTTEERVVHMEPTAEEGIFAPLTMEGTLLVDGLLSSCYAPFYHAVSCSCQIVPKNAHGRPRICEGRRMKGCGQIHKESGNSNGTPTEEPRRERSPKKCLLVRKCSHFCSSWLPKAY